MRGFSAICVQFRRSATRLVSALTLCAYLAGMAGLPFGVAPRSPSGCCCSAKLRAAGQCCCSRSASPESAPAGNGCCQKNLLAGLCGVAQPPATEKGKPLPPCCQAKLQKAGGKPHAPKQPLVRGCGCDEFAEYGWLIVTDPRSSCESPALIIPADLRDLLSLSCSGWSSRHDAPATPPPRLFSC
jgi:hypothetical protein